LILTKNTNPSLRYVETSPVPRIPEIQTQSKTLHISYHLASAQIGPGSYLGQQKLPTTNKKKLQRSSNWANDGRFTNFEVKQKVEADLPGPGSYQE